jgi:hypothetical protein
MDGLGTELLDRRASIKRFSQSGIEVGVVIHKRQTDGSWKWAVDIFNSDAATAEAEQTGIASDEGRPRCVKA